MQGVRSEMEYAYLKFKKIRAKLEAINMVSKVEGTVHYMKIGCRVQSFLSGFSGLGQFLT